MQVKGSIPEESRIRIACPSVCFQYSSHFFSRSVYYILHIPYIYMHLLCPFKSKNIKTIVCPDTKRNFQKKKWLNVLQISPYLTQLCPKIPLLVTNYHMFQDFSSGPLPQNVLKMVSKPV